MFHLYIKKDTTSKDFLKEVLKKYGLSENDIIYNEYNKPLIKDNKLYFSISHEKNICIIGISNKCIGVDIQYFTYNEKVIPKAFNPQEINILTNSNNKAYDFTKLWTMKEAYAKYIGRGLTYDFTQIDTLNLLENYAFIETSEYIISVYN